MEKEGWVAWRQYFCLVSCLLYRKCRAASHLGVIFLDAKYLRNDLFAKVFVDQAGAGEFGVEACNGDKFSTRSSMHG